MLISKTVCPAGSLLFIVPTGLQVTLRYDARGNLSKVFQDFDTKVDLGEDFMKTIVRMGLVPNGIKLTGGITDIWGVFYSDTFSVDYGLVPDCEFTRIAEDIMSGTPGYKFYIGRVNTGAASLVTPNAMTTWARLAKFEALPSWLVPEEPTDAMLEKFITSNRSIIFKFPIIAGYVICKGTEDPYYYPLNLRIAKVDKTKKYTDDNGFIKYDVVFGTNTITTNYPQAVSLNIQKGCKVLINRDQIIWSTNKSSAIETRLATRVACDSCGKILDIPAIGMLSCSDPFCTSHLFARINKFCNTLNLIPIPRKKFDKYVKSGDLQILPDLLLLDEYKDITIECNLCDLITACIPGDVGMNSNWMTKFCNKCNNQYKTVKYYLNGPIRINTELDMDVPQRFMAWLCNDRNLVELDTIVNSSQISIKEVGHLVKFDAPPIFHDKTIFITGTFVHGSLDDITAIFQSYGAVVVTEFDEFINFVVVGDIKENINGEAILGARALKIPTIDESDFFARYSIDQDLEKYLN